MKTSHPSLQLTLKAFGKCAATIANRAPKPTSVSHAELQIGVGTCADWIAWASRLRSLDFATSPKRGSPRSNSYLESTRFTYAWTAANALFGRDGILARLTSRTLPPSELRRFRILYDVAALTPPETATLLATLHGVLDSHRTPNEFPWKPHGPIRIIDLIYYKYTPDIYKHKGESARAIHEVVTGARPITSLDVPTIVYAVRNWTLHGALLDSSFRGSPKQFQEFMVTAIEALSRVLRGVAIALEATF